MGARPAFSRAVPGDLAVDDASVHKRDDLRPGGAERGGPRARVPHPREERVDEASLGQRRDHDRAGEQPCPGRDAARGHRSAAAGRALADARGRAVRVGRAGALGRVLDGAPRRRRVRRELRAFGAAVHDALHGGARWAVSRRQEGRLGPAWVQDAARTVCVARPRVWCVRVGATVRLYGADGERRQVIFSGVRPCCGDA